MHTLGKILSKFQIVSDVDGSFKSSDKKNVTKLKSIAEIEELLLVGKNAIIIKDIPRFVNAYS